MTQRAAPRTRSIAIAALAVVIVLGTFALARSAVAPSLPAPSGSAVAWDSVEWIRLEPGELNGPGRSALYDSRRTASGILAWGEFDVVNPAAPDGIEIQVVVWTSADGLAWDVVAFPGDGVTSFIADSVAAGDGGYLAVGRKGRAEAPKSAVMSTDGTAWVDALVPAIGDMPALLATDGSAFLAAGVRAGRPIVLSSEDGMAWLEEEVPAPPGIVAIGGLHATSAGVFLTGHVEVDRDWDALIWRRGSGAWAAIGPNDPALNAPNSGASVARVIPFEGGLLATGWAGPLEECNLGVGRLAAIGPLIADHCPGLPPATWVALDGNDWERVEGPRVPAPGAPAGVEAYVGDIGVGGDGLIGLFYEPDPISGDWPLGVWTSADARTWRRIANGMERGDAYAQATFVLPERLVVLGGTDDGRVIVWLGEPVDQP